MSVALAGLIHFEAAQVFGIVIAIPFFIAAVWKGEECMGGGDIKLIAALGFALGYASTVMCMAFFFASLMGYMFIKRIRQGNLRFAVPLIPFLTAGYIITIILEVLW